MKKAKLLILAIVALLGTGTAQATGPSYIYSEMRPVAINERGDVLCYTRFTRNEMGASYSMPVVYGWRVLTRDGETIDRTMHVTEWSDDDPEGSAAEREQWQSIYDGPFRERYLPADVQQEYGFSGEGVENFRVDRTMTLSEFRESTGIDLSTLSQRALWGGFSTNDYAERGARVHVMYDFGHVALLQNVTHYDPDEERPVGSGFNYVNGLFPELGFDISRVTGILYRFDK